MNYIISCNRLKRYFQMKFGFPIISQKYYSVHNQISRWAPIKSERL